MTSFPELCPSAVRRRRFTRSAAGLLAASALPGVRAQSDWPRAPMRLIVPYAPGGVTDLLMRLLARHAAERLGQPMPVENRAGSGGVVGTAAVARAAPDGLTIGAAGSSALIATPMLNPQIPFSVANDLAFVSLSAVVPMVLAVNAAVPVNTLAELLRHMKAQRGRLSYGSTAVGHYGHVALMAMSDAQDAAMVHAPYKGESPLVQDLVSGQIQLAFLAPSTVRPMVESGKVRLLACSGLKRLRPLPAVPTLIEQGLDAPVFRMNPGWLGIIAPARTPAPVLQRLSGEFAAVVRQPEVSDQIVQWGMEPVGSTAEAFAATYEAERPVWRELLTRAGLEVR